MADVVAQLLLQFGADLARLDTDMRKAVGIGKRGAAQMEADFVKAGKVIGAAFAGAVTAVAAIVKTAANSADGLGKLSQKIGTSVEFLSKLKYQAELADVSIQGLQTGFTLLSKRLTEARGGGEKAAELFKKLGVEIKGVSNEEVWAQLVQRFSQFRDGAAKTALAVQVFGRSGADLIPLLNEGAAGFARASIEAEKFGQVIDGKTAQAAEALNDNLTRLKLGIAGAGNAFLKEFGPALASASARIAEFGAATGKALGEGLASLVNNFDALAKAVRVSAEVVLTIWVARAMPAALLGLRAFITSLMLSLAPLAAFTGGVVTAGGVLTRMGVIAGVAGRGLLALVGGPIGAAVIAIGAIGIAWSEAARKEAEFQRSIKDAQKALEDFNRSANSFSAQALAAADPGAALIAAGNRVRALRDAVAFREQQLRNPAGGERGDAQVVAASAALPKLREQLAAAEKALASLNAETKAALGNFFTLGTTGQKAAEQIEAPVLDVSTAVEKTNESLAVTLKMVTDFRQKVADLAAKLSGPVAQAQLEYNRNLEELNTLYFEGHVSLEEATRAQRLFAEELKRTLDPADALIQDLEFELSLIGMTNVERQKAIELRRLEGTATAEQAAQIGNLVTQIDRQSEIAREAERAASEWQSAWQGAIRSVAQSFGTFVANGFKGWKGFLGSMKDALKRWVAEVISIMAQRALLNAFSGMGGGGGGGWGAMFAAALGGMGGGGGGGSSGGGWGQLMSLGTQYATGGSNGGGGGGFNLTSLLGGGSSLFGGASAAGYGATTGPFAGASASGTAGLGTGQLGVAGTAAAGLLGAYYGYNRTNGGAAGIGAAASYGALGIGVAGTAVGVAGGLGAGAAAGGAFAALGGAAWIPVVGWILAALALVDLASGGKLFGTKFKPKDLTSAINIAEGGGTASLTVRETRQRALFGGRQTRYRDIDAGDEARAVADQVFGNMQSAMETAAQRLGIEMPSIVGGAFKQLLDKKGKVKEEWSEVLGKRYNEDFETFQKRLAAEQVIAAAGPFASARATSTIAAMPSASSAAPVPSGEES